MQNKSLAFDLLSEAFQNPNPHINFSEHPITSSLIPEDKAELTLMLNKVQHGKQLYIQSQAGFMDIQKEQTTLFMNNFKNTMDSMIALKDSLKEAMTQAKKGYTYVMLMYVVVFYAGISLIITAVVFAAYGKTILAIAFGAIGLVDLVTYMLYKPPLDLQTSRSNFVQLSAALISWFTDVMNLNTYLSMKQQSLSFGDLNQVIDKQTQSTKNLMELIEKYSEPGKRSKKIKKEEA